MISSHLNPRGHLLSESTNNPAYFCFTIWALAQSAKKLSFACLHTLSWVSLRIWVGRIAFLEPRECPFSPQLYKFVCTIWWFSIFSSYSLKTFLPCRGNQSPNLSGDIKQIWTSAECGLMSHNLVVLIINSSIHLKCFQYTLLFC